MIFTIIVLFLQGYIYIKKKILFFLRGGGEKFGQVNNHLSNNHNNHCKQTHTHSLVLWRLYTFSQYINK